MDAPESPQIYLITPPSLDLDVFPDLLASVLDSVEIACIRLDLVSHEEDDLARAADTLRTVAHARDVALVISDHVLLAQRLGLDGVHLSDAAKSVRDTRKTLGPDAIVGCFCAATRHDGISAAEAGADYVSFGPIGTTSLGVGEQASSDLFQWWSDMIEVPVVAEGALDPGLIARFAPFTDFFGIGNEIWDADNPGQALKGLIKAL
ncbi:MAG: thiamine phosphate synthase [Rhodobacteraceae bacterium]|nr:thiamine phosphate synthase [Paracoccaceae bacterium]